MRMSLHKPYSVLCRLVNNTVELTTQTVLVVDGFAPGLDLRGVRITAKVLESFDSTRLHGITLSFVSCRRFIVQRACVLLVADLSRP